MFAVRTWFPRTALRTYATQPQPTAHPLVASLRAALKQSMLARTPDRTSVIKSILADIQTAAHSAGSSPSPLKTLASAISKRLDAAQTFRSSTPPRTDLADQYEQEAEVLREFVPQKGQPLSREELEKVVRQTLEDNQLKKAVGKDIGRIISLTMERTGDRADAKDVAAVVKSLELA
ncbi:hypothetical protein BMF94_1792 [Rhodotorula taiwanensis]|uniref:Altered inheritance of mitochondria protein 41 n=1 Tax=Rhodotorula taiwanensis TaxID=741276 RepID=A0A2S5BEH6_9BASI|nr:hypothetical protein BMF94_1792 [Rhodotorula taiwanensis]